jgi:hypothetical protein
VIKELRVVNESAARSLEEGLEERLEERLTLHHLELSPELERELQDTKSHRERDGSCPGEVSSLGSLGVRVIRN